MSDEEMKNFLRMRLQPKMAELPPVERRKMLREAFGLSQKELANQLGVSDAAVSKWESGKTSPRGEARRRYLAFCISAEEVLSEQKKGKADDSKEGTE